MTLVPSVAENQHLPTLIKTVDSSPSKRRPRREEVRKPKILANKRQREKCSSITLKEK